MKKNTRRFLSAVAAAAAVSLLAACGSTASQAASAPAGSADSTATAADSHKLTAYAWDKSFNIPALEAAAADYRENVDPEFELEIIEQSGAGDVETAVTLAGSAHDYSNLPDIVQFQDHYFQRYIADYPEVFVDVNDAEIDWSDINAEKLSYSTVDGVHYGVPIDSGTAIFAYRTDLLAEVGKTVEDMTGISWAEFAEIGAEVYAKTGKYLLSAPSDNGDLIYIMIQAEGASEFKDGEPYFTENETLRRVLETVVLLAQKNACYLANSWSDYIDQSIQGDMVAGVLNGNWIIPTIRNVTENAGKWEITSIPTLDGGEGYAANGGSALYITANCSNVTLAKSFLAYTFGGSTVTYDNALRSGGVVTTVASCGESEAYNEGVAFFNDQPIYAKIVEMGTHVPIIEQSDYHVRAGVYLTTAAINVINGSDLDTELANAEQQLRFEMGL